MSKKQKVEVAPLVIEFENIDELRFVITQPEISLVFNHYLKVLDDRVKGVVPKKEDLP